MFVPWSVDTGLMAPGESAWVLRSSRCLRGRPLYRGQDGKGGPWRGLVGGGRPVEGSRGRSALSRKAALDRGGDSGGGSGSLLVVQREGGKERGVRLVGRKSIFKNMKK